MRLANGNRSCFSRDHIYALLQECMRSKDLTACRAVYSLMIKVGLEAIAVLGDHLIRSFASCGALVDARHAFAMIHRPTVYTWNAIISAHASIGENEKVLHTHTRMYQASIPPDRVTFVTILKACIGIGNIHYGRMVHADITMQGLDQDAIVGSILLDMYAKHASVEEAHKVFDHLSCRDTISWGALIAGFLHHGCDEHAISYFQQMRQEGVEPNEVIYCLVAKACGSLRAISQGRFIHDQTIRNSFELERNLGNTLVDMYWKFGSIEEARQQFKRMPHHDLVSWSVAINGYVQHGLGCSAIELYEKMLQDGTKPDRATLLCGLQACGTIQALGIGMLIHYQVVIESLETDLAIQNALLDTYFKCGVIDCARKLFEAMENLDRVSCAVMISGYVQQEEFLPALQLFAKMLQDDIAPSIPISLCILRACGGLGELLQGMLMHMHIIELGIDVDLSMGNMLIYMYSKCKSLKEARKVFDELTSPDVVSWSTIMAGYAEQGDGYHAFELFETMRRKGVQPDKGIFLCCLNACGILGGVQEGRLIHQVILRSGVEVDAALRSALVDMYIRCKNLEDAYHIFGKSKNHDVVSWSALISGSFELGHENFALSLFEKMQNSGIEPDKVAFLCLFKVCGRLGALIKGRLEHRRVVESQLEHDACIRSALISMYRNCGALEDASSLTGKSSNQDLMAWGGLISGYALHGDSRMAKQCFKDMLHEGFEPDGALFTSILAACTHAGLVEEGCWYFRTMRENCRVVPSIEHFACIADLLGRAGYVRHAIDLLQSMPLKPDDIGCTSLLSSCKVHCNMVDGKHWLASSF